MHLLYMYLHFYNEYEYRIYLYLRVHENLIFIDFYYNSFLGLQNGVEEPSDSQ